MNGLKTWAAAALAAAGCALSASSLAAAPVFTILHTFSADDGSLLTGSPILASDGNLYGTASEGGSSGGGTLWRLAADGNFTVLHAFVAGKKAPEGNQPEGRLLQASDGLLYGVTRGGGTDLVGTVFRIAPDGSGYTVLHSFPRDHRIGWAPQYGLVQAADGNFYGTTSSHADLTSECAAGIDVGCGAVFRMAPDGTVTPVHRFEPTTEGFAPAGPLVVGKDGNLYGANLYGGSTLCLGAIGCGSLYRVGLDGKFRLLHVFQGTDGANPVGAISRGATDKLYGATGAGGATDAGTAFSLSPDGTIQPLHEFTSTKPVGSPLTGLTVGLDGNLYGAASYLGQGIHGAAEQGDLYRLRTSGKVTLLQPKVMVPDAMTLAPDGSFYGVSSKFGGTSFVFKMLEPAK